MGKVPGFRSVGGKLIDPNTGVIFPNVANLQAALDQLTAGQVNNSGYVDGEVSATAGGKVAATERDGIVPSSNGSQNLSVPGGVSADYSTPGTPAPGGVAPSAAGAFAVPGGGGNLALMLIQGKNPATPALLNQDLVFVNVPTGALADPLASAPDLTGLTDPGDAFEDFAVDLDYALLGFIPVNAAGVNIGCRWTGNGSMTRTCTYPSPAGDDNATLKAFGASVLVPMLALGPPAGAGAPDFTKTCVLTLLESHPASISEGGAVFNPGGSLPVFSTPAGVPLSPVPTVVNGTVVTDPLGAVISADYPGGPAPEVASMGVASYTVSMSRRAAAP